jgi:cob(I)alamin adenosyltransferase
MISITRVYTRTGDLGETALVGGKRVAKDSPRIAAYGTIDELNAVVGLARTFNAERLDQGADARWLDETLRRIQNELFDLGSELATPSRPSRGCSGQARRMALERLMDRCQEDLGRQSFVLPGRAVNAFLHQARTVCRRRARGPGPDPRFLSGNFCATSTA